MSQNLHVCQICGKKFVTAKGVYGHQRIHSGLHKIGGLKDYSSVSMETKTRKGYSFMTENEQSEVIEAAKNLVMISQRVHDFAAAIRHLSPGTSSMGLEVKPFQEKILHGNELKTELVTLSGFKKSRSCNETMFSGTVSRAVPCPLRSKLQKKTQFNYKCNLCDKSFGCSQALNGHYRIHRSNKERLTSKKEDAEDDNSVCDLSEANKIVPEEEKIIHHDNKIVSQPLSFDVSQYEILHSVESKLGFSEPLDNPGVGKSSRCSESRISGLLHSPIKSKEHSRFRFKYCRKKFMCSQALGGGHKALHCSIQGQLPRLEDYNSLCIVETTKSGSQASSIKI